MNERDKFVHKFIEKFDKIDPYYIEQFLTSLTHERNFLDDLVNLLDEGILVLNDKKEIVLINSAALNILGINNDNPVGKPVRKYINNDRLKLFFDKVWDLTDKSVNTELTLKYPRPMVLSVTIINYNLPEADNPYSKVFVFSDITDRMKKIAQLLKNEKTNTFNLLSAGVAHEIGNPLNSLDIHMQLLEKEIETVEIDRKTDILEYVRIARDEISRLDSIIKRFLKSIRPFRLNLRERCIGETVKRAISVLSAQINASGIETRLVIDKKIPRFLFDPDLIEQALRNIILNAVQAMPDGGKIVISAGIEKKQCVISIADSGRGIPRKYLKNIFDPYFTTRDDGTGLGLMIVNRIISAHDGQVSVVSEENNGTTFIISLPIKQRGKKLLPAHEKDGYE